VGWLDDGFSPSTNLTDAQKLVESSHVMAIVPMESAVATSATGAFLAQNKTPFLGWATNAAFVAAPTWGFSINGDQANPEVQGVEGMTQLLAALGDRARPKAAKVALIGEDVAGAAVAVKSLAGVAKFSGMTVVYQQSPIPVSGTTNFAPYAQNILSSGANLVYEVTDAPNGIGLAAALKSAGYQGIIVNGATYYPGQLASQPTEASGLNGVYVENEFPADENRTPAVQQAINDLKAAGLPPYLTQGISVGYWSAILFEQMLKATLAAVGGDPAKVTGSTLQQTVNKGFSYVDPAAGGIGPERFPAAETTPTGCGTLLKISGTSYVQVEPYQCGGAVNVGTGKMVSQQAGTSTP
jgi:ABC-type branched-subunit amino acid transport system substrate-binding protein